MQTKKCSKCGETKSVEEFNKNATGKNGLQSQCGACMAAYSRAWRAANPEAKKAYSAAYYTANREAEIARCKAYNRKRFTGMTPDVYNQLFNDQGGCCAICGTHQNNLKKALNADHCHHTGDTRGLLCTKCNTAIGMLDDNPDLGQAATEYLRMYHGGGGAEC